jgi:Protein of unknown function (DUF3617)
MTMFSCKRATVVALISLGLGACNSGGVSAENASVEDVAEQIARSDVALRPGRWETSVAMDGKPAPGPAGGADAMATCLSAADIDKMDSKMMQKPMESCVYDSFTMAGGKIAGAMSCKPPAGGGPAMKMTMAGTYTPETYNLDMTTEIAMGGQTQKTAMQVTSKRVGECDGTEIKAPAG